MTVPGGMTYFLGALKSSVRNHPLMSAGLLVGLNNSTASPAGGSSCVKTSLTTTGGRSGGGGSLAPARPGDPLMALLGRQLLAKFHALGAAVSSVVTSEKPKPSVVGYQLLLKVKSRTGSWRGPCRLRCSPPLLRLPPYSPAMLK